MTRLLLTLTMTFFAGACGGGDEGTGDASDAGQQNQIDADTLDANSSVADCSGDDSVLRLRGAFERDISPFVWVTVADQIKGFGGVTDSVTFGTSSGITEGFLHDVGSYDVTDPEFNMVYKEFTAGDPLCETDPCEGFYALSGTFEVTEHGGVYRAVFELSTLHEFGADGPGDAVAGTVTGCLAVDAP